MKKLFGALLALVSSAAISATLNPIQLLNPTGSTPGQVIISTGSGTAPAWSNVPATALASQSANSVIANVTGSAASPTVFVMPSCSAAGNNLQWTSGAGFTCATGYAQLASPTFTGTVTTAALTATGAITPSQTAGIVGTTTNNNANSGSIGEHVSNSATGASLSNSTVVNGTSISLTAGDWDAIAQCRFNTTTATIASGAVGISTTSATYGAFGTIGNFVNTNNSVATTNTFYANTIPVRLSLSATTTIYAVTSATFAAGTVTVDCFIRARRVR
jgi:hypothetical protein